LSSEFLGSFFEVFPAGFCTDERLACLAELFDLTNDQSHHTWMGVGTYSYRFFEASLQILYLNFLLKRDVADGVSLLAELAPEFFTVEEIV
jgi:hypothetical protein